MIHDQTYNIIAPNKCGSSVLFRILTEESSLVRNFRTGLFREEEEEEILDKSLIYELPGISSTDSRVIEINATRHVDYLENCNSQDKMVFILRNPIAKAISAFYSYNYTHRFYRVNDPDREREKRKQNRRLGLHGYVMKHIDMHARNIQQLWDYPSEHKLLLPYELMVTKFDKFLHKLLSYMDMEELYDTIYSRHYNKFRPVPDLTHQIVHNKLKVHKRTSNINEWREKIPQNLIDEMCNKHPIISTYQNFLDEHLRASEE